MMDAELRRLERAARELPDDAARGWALARALGRAGERRAELLALAALARSGDAEAAGAVASAAPWPTAAWRGPKRARRPGLRDAPRVAGKAVVPMQGQLGFTLATDEQLLLIGEDEVRAVDVARLETTFRDALGARASGGVGRAWFGLRGSDLVRVEAGADARMRIVETGEGRALCDLPLQRLGPVAVDGDLVVGQLWDGAGPLVGFSAGDDPGREMWRSEPSGRLARLASGRAFLVGADRAVIAHEGRLGRPLWSAPTGSFGRLELIGADERVVLALGSELDDSGYNLLVRGRRLFVLDAATGDRRFVLRIGAPVRDDVTAALGEDSLVLLRRDLAMSRRGCWLCAVALDGAGEERWRVPAPRAAEARQPAVALATDVAFVAWPDPDARAVCVAAFDLETGEALWETAVGAPEAADADGVIAEVGLVPLHRALLVLAAGLGETVLARLHEPGVESEAADG